jgi:hemerythrin-like domain-containing protein
MRRHDALIPLSHDHHHALVQVRRLKLAAETGDEERMDAARAFLDFFREDTVDHFREEEEKVFPLGVDSPELRGTLSRVMFEHLRIHKLVLGLHEAVSNGAVDPDQMVQLASVLERHIRFEEKVVFPEIERVAADVLNAVVLTTS